MGTAPKIADLTLDEVIQHLIAGNALDVAGGAQFSLAFPDSRALLAFYNRDRQAYWNPEKNTAIQDGEIDKVLAALDTALKIAPIPSRTSRTQQLWQLATVSAHRFRGLHRHCAEKGADPHLFELELSADVTLLRGFNGAGKTSLISAICWCLTGYGHRSQGLPSPLHEQIQVRVPPADGGGADEAKVFGLPVIVPVPTEEELAAVDGVAKSDTWVRLTFRSLIGKTRLSANRCRALPCRLKFPITRDYA